MILAKLLLLAILIVGGAYLPQYNISYAKELGYGLWVICPFLVWYWVYNAVRVVDMSGLKKVANQHRFAMRVMSKKIVLSRQYGHGKIDIDIEAPTRFGLKRPARYKFRLFDGSRIFWSFQLTWQHGGFASGVLPHSTLRVPGLPPDVSLEAGNPSITRLISEDFIDLLNSFPFDALEQVQTSGNELIVIGHSGQLTQSMTQLMDLVGTISREFCEEVRSTFSVDDMKGTKF